MDNTTAGIGSADLSEHRASFALQFGVSVGVFALVVTSIIASYFFCNRKNIPTRPSQRVSTATLDHDSATVVELGLYEATANSYPRLLYSQAKLDKGDAIAQSCSICLADYKERDMVRLMPECDHIFHLQCIDPWLRLHTTCPMCRSSLSSTSMTSDEIPFGP
ncbi:putative RING-H2 finger protein ATL71 [Tripterygium wilfordii]|uniref:Putative RING-H2 finger protein ATL71 n=1 Tax=Tripterygium wilfordii TaxID=458696 RepID=A0A7J7C5E6_TRIWF|nr:putative RING-H2 finger protein ATL71 [Tripterygium wilfordii]KAF5729390.1 putative RING-H2 finger protein ATL71 [Tripterygium wilfordii]